MKKINKGFTSFVVMFISLFIIALFTAIYCRSIFDVSLFGFNTLKYRSIWIGFSISWIAIILLIMYLINKNKRVKVFTILSIILNVVLFAQICYTRQLGKFMVVSDLFLAGEGLQYVKSVFLNLHLGMLVTVIINLLLLILLNYLDRKNKDKENAKNINKYIVVLFIFVIVITRCTSYLMLGRDVDTNSWQENYNTKNIYNNYTNPNSAMFVSGFYEYHVRAIYKYFYNLITLDKVALKLNIDNYNSIYGTNKTNNEYTGIFKDKSVIFVMMESIDSWIVDDETMPTLKYLMSTGMNFTNRYSPFFNGGQTINSEFALNTGMYAISDKKTIYDIDDVDYPYSLANTLKRNDYSVNSFHANTGKFYNRTLFHQRLGYNHHYSAVDLQKAGIISDDKNYYSDSEFINDDYLYNLFTSDEKFLSFITTYSAHLEYTEDNKVYKTIEHPLDVRSYEKEEYVYRTLASDTDKFLRILLQKLENTGKIDEVIIVLATDHYVYGYSDTNYVALMKDTINDGKHLQQTPFVIWSKDIEHEDIDIILDTADILPTLLNMLDIEYNPNNYLGEDVFSETHDNFVWFADGTYIEDKNSKLSNEAILTKVNYNIAKNKSILLTNYYGDK